MPNTLLSKLAAIGALLIAIVLFYQWSVEEQLSTFNNSVGSDNRSASHSLQAQPAALLATKEPRQTNSPNTSATVEHVAHDMTKQNLAESEQSLKTAYQSKQKYAQEKVKQALAEMNSHTDGQNKTELMQQHAASIATRQHMKQTAQNGDWEAFLDARNQLNDMMGAGDMLSLMDAIQYRAPKHVIQKLLRTGSQFTPDMLMFLAINNDVEQVQMLISLGFDIHMTDRYAKNALLYSIEFNADKVFRFLLVQGVSVEPARNGFDALDTALEALLKPQNKSLMFVHSLLELDTYLKPSHAYLLSQLERQRPAIYQEIMSQHAVLRQ